MQKKIFDFYWQKTECAAHCDNQLLLLLVRSDDEGAIFFYKDSLVGEWTLKKKGNFWQPL